ncbi:hypothetical protein KIPE111705_22710 [Kibdelosporangium persicum]|uniref:DUF8017 domain-containing protein n=1 Tax=Kibdelosporangium persicum TaxID=2698649 RepID=A0ABX2FET1_9PSEU|nr:hypothetical protein [Kibdelosporangium persicum]NRN69644.1 hypothetical protein [Kibdelosporangium persicum]
MPNDYRGLGLYDDTPPAKRNGVVLAAVIAAVVVIGAVAALMFVRVTSTTSGQALPVAGATTATKPKDPLQPRTTGTPRVPGWQVISISNTDKAYDVPPGWSTIGSDLATFGDHQEVSFVTPTIYKPGYCPDSPKSWRGMAGIVVMPNKGNIEVGAAAAAQQIANTVFTTKDRVQPETDIGDPKPITILKGTKAVVVTATLKVPVTEKDKCAAADVAIALMMVEPTDPNASESATVVAMADQNVPEATPEQDLTQIVTSFHVFS